MSAGSVSTTSAEAPPSASRNCPLRWLSPATSNSMAPSLNRKVAAMPSKSRNLALRSSAIDEPPSLSLSSSLGEPVARGSSSVHSSVVLPSSDDEPKHSVLEPVTSPRGKPNMESAWSAR